MEPAKHEQTPRRSAEIIDFDDAVLRACSPDLRDELAAEAKLLASALPHAGRPDELRAMAQSVAAAARQSDGGARARLLAASLRDLARRLEL